MTVEKAKIVPIDSETERDYFLSKGLVVTASMDERAKIKSHGQKLYEDGRPFAMCRISNCFTKSNASQSRFYLCPRHYNMIEG